MYGQFKVKVILSICYLSVYVSVYLSVYVSVYVYVICYQLPFIFYGNPCGCLLRQCLLIAVCLLGLPKLLAPVMGATKAVRTRTWS